jgi:hypothetical protein
VPRQYSSGGKPKLGRISKMGNRHLRKLLVLGAHAVLYSIKNGKTKSPLADSARALLAKRTEEPMASYSAEKRGKLIGIGRAQNIRASVHIKPRLQAGDMTALAPPSSNIA